MVSSRCRGWRKASFGRIGDDGVALGIRDNQRRFQVVQDRFEQRVQDLLGVIKLGMGQKLSVAGDIGNEESSRIQLPYFIAPCKGKNQL